MNQLCTFFYSICASIYFKWIWGCLVLRNGSNTVYKRNVEFRLWKPLLHRVLWNSTGDGLSNNHCVLTFYLKDCLWSNMLFSFFLCFHNLWVYGLYVFYIHWLLFIAKGIFVSRSSHSILIDLFLWSVTTSGLT